MTETPTRSGRRNRGAPPWALDKRIREAIAAGDAAAYAHRCRRNTHDRRRTLWSGGRR